MAKPTNNLGHKTNNLGHKKQHERAWHEGTVTAVRPGVWRAWRVRTQTPSGSTLRPSRTFKGDDAEQRAKMWARGDVEPPVLLLGHWLDRWLALATPTIDDATRLIYRRAVAACAPIAQRPLADLTADEWQGLTNRLLERWARYTVKVWRDAISTALGAAVRRGILQRNPLRDVKLPRPPEQIPRAWRQDEVDRLLTAADGGPHEAWLQFALGTGIRLGEARALLWEDVDLKARTATIRASLDNVTSRRGPTKSRRIRVVDIPDEVIPLLVAGAARQRPGESYVFGHRGKPYHASTYRCWLRNLCGRAKVRVLPPHSLRHTCASLAFDDRQPVQDVARQLGHSVQVCQTTYAHFIGDDQRRVASSLGKALRHHLGGPESAPRAKNGTREGA